MESINCRDISHKIARDRYNNGDRIALNDVDDDQDVLIYADQDVRLKKFKNYVVETKHSFIVNTIKAFWRMKLRGELDGYIENLLRAIKKYSVKRIDKERTTNFSGKVYQDWCADIVIFYCWRKVIESKDISIVLLKESLADLIVE
jgi:hypothetical protein